MNPNYEANDKMEKIVKNELKKFIEQKGIK